jgi:protocatechuate 3,4-dioxygenase beta subunit
VPPTGEAWPEVEIALAKGVILEGTVTHAEGAPISGARVSVRGASPRGAGSAPDLAMILTTRTAFSGKMESTAWRRSSLARWTWRRWLQTSRGRESRR